MASPFLLWPKRFSVNWSLCPYCSVLWRHGCHVWCSQQGPGEIQRRHPADNLRSLPCSLSHSFFLVDCVINVKLAGDFFLLLWKTCTGVFQAHLSMPIPLRSKGNFHSSPAAMQKTPPRQHCKLKGLLNHSQIHKDGLTSVHHSHSLMLNSSSTLSFFEDLFCTGKFMPDTLQPPCLATDLAHTHRGFFESHMEQGRSPVSKGLCYHLQKSSISKEHPSREAGAVLTRMSAPNPKHATFLQ